MCFSRLSFFLVNLNLFFSAFKIYAITREKGEERKKNRQILNIEKTGNNIYVITIPILITILDSWNYFVARDNHEFLIRDKLRDNDESMKI